MYALFCFVSHHHSCLMKVVFFFSVQTTKSEFHVLSSREKPTSPTIAFSGSITNILPSGIPIHYFVD